MEIDLLRVQTVASVLGTQSASAVDTISRIDGVLGGLGVDDLWGPVKALLAEFGAEGAQIAMALVRRADLAEGADSGWSRPRYEYELRRLDELVGAVRGGLADGVGSDASVEDLRRQIERFVFGPAGAPSTPLVLLEPSIWEAENVTATVLDGASADDAAAYWNLLDDDRRYAVIQVAPASVSPHHLSGAIALDDVQRFALAMQPVPTGGTQPSSGVGTDWIGNPIPVGSFQPGTVVRAFPIDEISIGVGIGIGAHVSAEVDGGGVAILPENLACTGIQAFSLIPSRPDPSVVGVGAAAYTTYSTVRTLSSPVKLISPPAWAATLADLFACRFEMGSGEPISTERVVTDDGDVVYESSRSDQPYMDAHGVPLSPDPRVRDRQLWNIEHNVADGTWAPYPEDEYPVFGPDAGG